MISILKKLNWGHIGLIALLPIILALINPNWIFNLSITDDYLYFGYQMGLPKYVGWNPSADSYYIERIAFILQGFVIRQLFSPLMANFILHLGVYYLATFSVYGLLNKLFNGRVALITVLLFGQFPMIMRATGWDYLDGYVMALFALTLFFLTQSVQSRRRPLYLIGAGACFMIIINSNFFNMFYAPALAIYLVFLEDLYKKPIYFIKTGVYVLLGIVFMAFIQVIIYYQFTGRLLFINSWSIAQSERDYLQTIIFNVFNVISPDWYWFLGFVPLLAIRQLLTTKSIPLILHPELPFNANQVQRAVIGLFLSAYVVIIFWRLLGFIYTNVSVYHANIIMFAFLVMGMWLAKIIDDNPIRFRYITLAGLLLPMLALFCFTMIPAVFNPQNIMWAFLAGVICATVVLFSRHRTQIVYALITFSTMMGIIVAGSGNIQAYNPNRYQNQHLYEQTVQVVEVINDRYDTLSLDTFRLWYQYDPTNPQFPIFRATAAVYLLGWGGRAHLGYDFPPTDFIMTDEIIILSNQKDTQTALETPLSILNHQLNIIVRDELVIGDVRLLFSYISLFNQDSLRYNFSSEQSLFVLEESGWNGYEGGDSMNRFRWTAEPTARVVIDATDANFTPQNMYRIGISVVSSLEEEVVNSLKFFINGESIALTREGNWFVGMVDGLILNSPTLDFLFETDRVSNPFDLGIQDGRKLGVALGQLIIEPVIDGVGND